MLRRKRRDELDALELQEKKVEAVMESSNKAHHRSPPPPPPPPPLSTSTQEKNVVDEVIEAAEDCCRMSERVKKLSQFAVIALLYLGVNNLKTYAVLALDPGSFVILNNLSIITTALLYRVVFGRPFSNYMIVALILLMTGLLTTHLGMLVQVTHYDHIVGHHTPHPDMLRGTVVMVVASVLSSVADVFNEFAFKDSHDDEPTQDRHSVEQFMTRSMYLYVFGVLFNAVLFYQQNHRALAVEFLRILHMDRYTMWMIFNFCFGGISVGICFRFTLGGNLNKMFADAAGLLLTLILSYLLLGIRPGLDLLLGILVVYCSIYLYSSESMVAWAPENSSGASKARSSTANSRDSLGIADSRNSGGGEPQIESPRSPAGRRVRADSKPLNVIAIPSFDEDNSPFPVRREATNFQRVSVSQDDVMQTGPAPRGPKLAFAKNVLGRGPPAPTKK